MTFGTLIRRSLRFHWRAHLGVVLGAAIGSAALIGALVVGDSVRESLRWQALRRVWGANVTLDAGDRFFGDDLLKRMIKLGAERARPLQANPANSASVWGNGFTEVDSRIVLRVPVSAARQDGKARANRVQLFGVTDETLVYLESGRVTFPGDRASPWPSGKVLLNHSLADQLGVSSGDELIFRVPKASSLSHESAIASRNDSLVALRLSVAGIATWSPANFDPHGGARPALNAFMQIEDLGQAIGREGAANLILASPASQMRTMNRWDHFRNAWRMSRSNWARSPLWNFGWLKASGGMGLPLGDQATIEAMRPLLRDVFNLRDAELQLLLRKRLPDAPDSQLGSPMVELKTARIFVPPPIVKAVLAAETNAQPILTYLANLLRAGTNTTPYSMVTAAGTPWTPADMRDDEILVSQWLGEDLHVKPGDEIALTYFDPESGARLAERTNTFRVRGVVPMEMPWADRTLMPDFPGIEKAESTSEWDVGFPLVHKIRAKDEDYWKQHRGTPKAFVTLAAGKKMWANRFGDLTAIRFPIPTSVEAYRAALEKKILANLKPEELGLRFEPVREQALKAAEQSQDFGGLFLGFSFFLIIAALLLMAMLFSLGLEQRAPEIGTLLALGFTPKQVRRLLLREGVALSLLGGILGALGGLAYARTMLHGLTTVWRDAVGTAALSFHFTLQTLVIGLFASVVVSAVTIWVTLRRFARRPATELLAGEVHSPEFRVHSRGRVIGFVALIGASGLAGWTLVKGDTANTGAFFGAGALALVAGLNLANAWLARLVGSPLTLALSPSDGERQHRPQPSSGSDAADTSFTLSRLAVRGCARQRKRSLATVAMLACGSFLIVSIGVFRLDANRDATKRASGTGGFALIGESTMPVVQDLNSQSGREFLALNENDLKGVSFVPFRVREGDEASCLNLNRAQRPRLLGVKPQMLEGRFSFAKGEGWKTLINTRLQPGESAAPESENRLNGFPQRATSNTGLKPGANEIEIPAIGDANSIQWAMHKKVGDTIDYVDERGQSFKVRIVGAVANSILQGSLIIDEAEFVKRFPGESGYRMFLIDAPSNAVSQVSATLSRAMQDVGLELTPTAQRLAQFNAVQNTYLGTFQVLGGLGLLLGSVGLGIVVLRNVLERRGELAVLLAVGFRTRVLQRLVLIEHGALLALGLALGIVAAAVAVLATLLSPSAQLPYVSLALTLGAVLVNGALWTWMATRAALRGNLLAALRNE